jgi:hypothetical protein
VRSGAGVVALVEGEPGMGKTRLLAEAARVARRLAFRVGAGAASRTLPKRSNTNNGPRRRAVHPAHRAQQLTLTDIASGLC